MWLVKLRRIIQIVALLFFTSLFLFTRYPLKLPLPPDTLLRLDPLVYISGFLSTYKLYFKFLAALVIILLTILLGRFFCAWLCPLGTILDVSYIFRRRIKKLKAKLPQRLRNFKFYLLLFVLAAAFISLQFLYLFDPLVNFYRALYFDSRFIPASLAKPTGYIFPTYGILQLIILLLPALLAASILFVFIYPRIWCHSLCPLGALLSLFGRLSPLKRIVSEQCNRCGICGKECTMQNINIETGEYLPGECLRCFSCLAVCPRGAVSFKFRLPKLRIKEKPVELSRRAFLYSGATILSSLVVSKLVTRKSEPSLLRPPAALAEKQFLATCQRCAACIKVCPSGILQLTLLEAGFESFWTPRFLCQKRDGTRAKCELCMLCGQVCPSGAIREISEEDFKRGKVKVGTARIELSQCIAWSKGLTCLVCVEYCPVNAIYLDDRMRPVVTPEKCIGCASCEYGCPVKPAAIKVFPEGAVRFTV